MQSKIWPGGVDWRVNSIQVITEAVGIDEIMKKMYFRKRTEINQG